MKICVPKETHPSENRVTLIPLNVKKLVDLGAEVFFQSGLGEGLHITDGEYEKAGGKAIANRDELFKNADIIARIRRPELEELEQYPEGCISVSYLDPFNNPKTLEKLNQKKITSISIDRKSVV